MGVNLLDTVHNLMMWIQFSATLLLLTKGILSLSIFGQLFFLIYINDLPFILKDTGTSILFADDIVYSYSNSIKFVKEIKLSFTTLNAWFENKMLALNCNKTNFIQFTRKPNNNINLSINYSNNHISNNRA
jgi:hypothetical protein